MSGSTRGRATPARTPAPCDSSTGTLLASGTFSNETASGWQSLTFASPVNVKANTVYVVAYFAPSGHYSDSPGYFGNNTASYNQLHAIADGVSGGNGVYGYSGSPTFPSNTYNATNYWVDVLLADDRHRADGHGRHPGERRDVGGPEHHPDRDDERGRRPEHGDVHRHRPGGAKLSGTTTLSGNTLTFTPSAPLAPRTRGTAAACRWPTRTGT